MPKIPYVYQKQEQELTNITSSCEKYIFKLLNTIDTISYVLCKYFNDLWYYVFVLSQLVLVTDCLSMDKPPPN